jgi:hypothetical protein
MFARVGAEECDHGDDLVLAHSLAQGGVQFIQAVDQLHVIVVNQGMTSLEGRIPLDHPRNIVTAGRLL